MIVILEPAGARLIESDLWVWFARDFVDRFLKSGNMDRYRLSDPQGWGDSQNYVWVPKMKLSHPLSLLAF